MNFIEENVNFLIEPPEDMIGLSYNSVITDDFVCKHPKGLNGFEWRVTHIPIKFIMTNSHVIRCLLLTEKFLEEMLEPHFLFNSKSLTPNF